MSRTRLPTSQIGVTFHTRRGRRYQIPGPAGGVGQQKRSGGSGGGGGAGAREALADGVLHQHQTFVTSGSWDLGPSSVCSAAFQILHHKA